MRACFVSSVFNISPKSPFTIFTPKNISLISREYIFIPLRNRRRIKKILTSIKIFKIIILNPTISIFVNKLSKVESLQQYIIAHQPWPMELANLTNSLKKTEIDLTTQQILLHNHQPILIVTTGSM